MELLSNITIITFAYVILVAYYALALTPQESYWNAALPNTPMPSALRSLIGTEGTTDNYNFSLLLEESIPKTYKEQVWANKAPWVFLVPYGHAASAEEVHAYQNNDIFFFEGDIIKGKKMYVQFSPPVHKHIPFLPREKVEKVPFESKPFIDILKYFSMKPDSLGAKKMKETIATCESPGIPNEQKYCATSLESMIDHCISKLGKNIHALSTDVERETSLQRYTITDVRKISGDIGVSCHQLKYIQPVFYCHSTGPARLYMVSLVGEDGTKVKAVSVCHLDSKHWSPYHMSFQVLKVKPGTVPICHFLFVGHVLWTKK